MTRTRSPEQHGAHPNRSSQAGHTLSELSIAMAITGILSTGFFQAFGIMSDNLSQETVVSLYQDTVRQALYQIARDIRLAGANPTANPDLFDNNPATDVAVDLDPDGDGDITNGILVRADKRGTDTGEADGEIDDTLEAVMFHHDRENAQIMRHVWRVPVTDSGLESQDHGVHQAQYDSSPFVSGVCTFSLRYYDRLDQATTDPEQVSTVVIELTSASGPADCHETDSFTRYSHAIVRIRNR